MLFIRNSTRKVIGAAMAMLALSPGAGFAQVGEVITAQLEADRAAAASQTRVDELRDEASDAAQQYAQFLAEAESLEKYNAQLADQVESQAGEIASIQRQLTEIEVTNREIQPLMEQMVAALKEFVALDVPFLPEERTRRVQNLEETLARADVSISEKYRRILEAYQIELEYGRTLEAYEGTLADGAGGAPRTVEFVRLGRLSLMYRTPDGAEVGYWDKQQHGWVVDADYAEAVAEALRVAQQNGSPDLLTIPVPAPEGV
jgi:hypothetical protein